MNLSKDEYNDISIADKKKESWPGYVLEFWNTTLRTSQEK